MDRLRFRDVMYKIFDITDDLILDRIFRYFDTNNDAVVSFLLFFLFGKIESEETREHHF